MNYMKQVFGSRSRDIIMYINIIVIKMKEKCFKNKKFIYRTVCV